MNSYLSWLFYSQLSKWYVCFNAIPEILPEKLAISPRKWISFWLLIDAVQTETVYYYRSIETMLRQNVLTLLPSNRLFPILNFEVDLRKVYFWLIKDVVTRKIIFFDVGLVKFDILLERWDSKLYITACKANTNSLKHKILDTSLTTTLNNSIKRLV